MGIGTTHPGGQVEVDGFLLGLVRVQELDGVMCAEVLARYGEHSDLCGIRLGEPLDLRGVAHLTFVAI